MDILFFPCSLRESSQIKENKDKCISLNGLTIKYNNDKRGD
jgi:hypothetical protein